MPESLLSTFFLGRFNQEMLMNLLEDDVLRQRELDACLGHWALSMLVDAMSDQWWDLYHLYRRRGSSTIGAILMVQRDLLRDRRLLVGRARNQFLGMLQHH